MLLLGRGNEFRSGDAFNRQPGRSVTGNCDTILLMNNESKSGTENHSFLLLHNSVSNLTSLWRGNF